ncbi:hypothetical protein, partial [Aeromonas media]|uniref:hypothetical protein n=1 Tax=Aeromonas media TaxID=651 RepID=UPI001C55C6CE
MVVRLLPAALEGEEGIRVFCWGVLSVTTFWLMFGAEHGWPLLALMNLSTREFNFEVQFPIKNQAAFRSSSKTTCGCLNPKHLRGLKFSRFS